MSVFYSNNNYPEKIQFIEKKSSLKKEKEDALSINNKLRIYSVMDGSTPIDSFKDEYGYNSAYLAANLIKDYFDSLTTSTYLPLEVLNANKLLKKQMEENKINLNNKTELWSTCISSVQIEKDNLIYASLGDTMILIWNYQGEINELTVNTVKNISMRGLLSREIKRYNGMEIPNEEYFKKEKNKIAYHRQLANTPNGYSIANGMSEAKYYIQAGMVDIKNIKHVLIMSDGLFDSKSDLRIIFRKIVEEGLENYVEELIYYEKKYEKIPDDKTAILLTF